MNHAIYIYNNMCVDMCIYTYYIYTHIYCVYIYIYIHMYTSLSIHIYIYTHTYIHTYMCVRAEAPGGLQARHPALLLGAARK